MSMPRRPSAHQEPLFTEIPAPAQVPVTVVSPMMAPPPALTPKQILRGYSADQWEQFILEWVLALKQKAGYVDVVRPAGANDRGVDVAAFLSVHKTDGPWHAFQCKHYEASLVPSMAYPEMLKIFVAVAEEEYRLMPERYVFVAPKIGASLLQLVVKPEQLKEKFFAEAAKPGARLGAGYRADVLAKALEVARGTDFSCFEVGNPDVILEEHAQTRFHVARFGTPLPTRPAREGPPDEYKPDEVRYIQQLLNVYAEKWGCPSHSPEAAHAHPRAGKHLRTQRVAFYCAEQLRVFARDSVPYGTFEGLQEEIHSHVSDVADRDFDTGYDRVTAVLDAACYLQLSGNILVQVVDNRDRTGICHQLANDEKLTWCGGEGEE